MDKNKIFFDLKVQQYFQNEVVVNFYDGIKVVHCALILNKHNIPPF